MLGAILLLVFVGMAIGAEEPLPGTSRLTIEGDLATQMVEGIGRFLDREIEASKSTRALGKGPRNGAAVEKWRAEFRRIIGAGDSREPARWSVDAGVAGSAWLASGDGYRVYAVRWSVLKGVEAEGLLLEPQRQPVANVVALPDCDCSPEMAAGLVPGPAAEVQFPRRLALAGCRVVIPLLMDRRDTFSGNPSVRMTNQPHREFLYRASYEMGRHIIGFEVQKVLAAVDWLETCDAGSPRPVGVMGYGEGGLLAFYAAAADTRIASAGVCGYFGPRESVWREPIYRNVWALLKNFGDAEIASLIAPRALVVEASPQPAVAGPPEPSKGRTGAAPGVIITPDTVAVEGEFRRALSLIGGENAPSGFRFMASEKPASEGAVEAMLRGLGVSGMAGVTGESGLKEEAALRAHLEGLEARFGRQFDQLVEHTQYLMREGEFRRAEFWSKAEGKDSSAWEKASAWHREYFRDEVIGRLPAATLPLAPKSRQIFDEPGYRGYEYVLQVQPDIFASGILLVPKDVRPGERRPVVVCQHGLEGRPRDCADPAVDHPAYHRFACALAERGFITCAPQNPYIGKDDFRVLQRKANPLGQSLFSFIVQQHERLIEWLRTLDFVDPARIGFYGLSYGGKTAMRVPALVDGYCLSICSGDFNEWIWKNCSARHRYSYLFTGEYEMYEFDLGNTFNYAEMSWLICPRPFMVERGHRDGVAPDEWVAYEFAKTWRRYDQLGIGDRSEIEFFDGPHTINGKGSFEFLHRHLKWPSGK